MKKRTKRKNIPIAIRREVEALFGSRCWHCGTDRQVDLHHIIPAEMGGEDSAHNLIPLCRKCHMRAHNKNQKEYYNPGRPRKTKDIPNWESVIEDYLTCRIGTKECKELLKISKGSHISDRSYFKEYLRKKRIKAYRNNLDLIAQHWERLGKDGQEGKITGWIEYQDGTIERFEWVRY